MWGERPAASSGTTITKARMLISTMAGISGTIEAGMCGVGNVAVGSNTSRRMRRAATGVSTMARRCNRVIRARC